MSKTTILYSHEFASAHRLMGHPGKCAHLHGHNYTITVEIEHIGPTEDMVMDFGDVKKVIGKHLDDKFDHATLLQEHDPLVDAIKNADPEAKLLLFIERPTAEVMAKLILVETNILLTRHKVIRVTVQEAKGQSAVYNTEGGVKNGSRSIHQLNF